MKGERRPINSNDPMTGYYRARSKNKQTNEERLYAVAYWWHKGVCFCKVDGGDTLQGEKLQRMIGSWPFVSKEPIAYDVYQSVVAGNPWPDQHVAPKAAPAETSDMPLDVRGDSPAPPTGAADQPKPAEPVDDSPKGILKREIDAAIAGITNYVKKDENGKIVSLITSDAMAGAAQSLRAQLLAASNKAKKAREEANRPHQDAIKANGLLWSPLETIAKATADDLRDGPMKAWEIHKREQEAAAAKATVAANAANVRNAVNPMPVQVSSNAPAPSARIKGATGKAASVTEVKIAVIHDQDLVYAHFKNNDQVKAILQGLANAAVRAGIEVPGTTTDKDVAIK